LFEQPVISDKLDHRAAGHVLADDVASFEKVAQQRASLSAGIEWQSGNGHRLSLSYVLAQPWRAMVNER
jgi:hypothetical protein